MPRVGTAFVSIRARLDRLEKDLDTAKSKTLRSANETSRAVSNVFKGAVAAFGTYQIKQFGESIFNTGREVARLEKAFTEITGSMTAAGDEFQFLRDVSADLGQNFYDLASEYKSLLAASRGTALEGKATRDVFIGITKAAASLGLTSDQTAGALNAIQQMMSKGKVQAEELRGQLGERLPGAFNLAAEAMGVTTAELDKMLKDGKVLAADLLPRLATVLGKRYTGEVDAATRASNELSQAWMDMKSEMAKSGFLDSVSSAMQALADVMADPGLQQGLKDFARNVGSAVEAMAQLAKYAGLRSITGTFDQALELSKKGLLDLTEFARMSFTERQKLVDDILGKQAQLNQTFKIGPSTPGYPTSTKALPSPAATTGATRLGAPSADDWALFYNDELAGQKDALSKALSEIERDIDRYGGSLPTAADWELFYNDDLAAQKDQLSIALTEIEADIDGMEKTGVDASDTMKSAFAGWAASFGQDLNEMVWGAETSFGDIAKSFGKMVTQIMIQKSLVEPFVKTITGWLPSGSGNYIPSAYGMDTRATGGPVYPGQTYLVGEKGPELLTMGSNSGYVHPNGAGGGVTVNVINNNGSSVKTRSRQGANGPELDVIVDNMVASKLAQSGSASNKALRQLGGSLPLIQR